MESGSFGAGSPASPVGIRYLQIIKAERVVGKLLGMGD